MAVKGLAHYSLIRPLGAGGMGEVHLARDNSLGRQVAIKLLPESSHHNTQRRKRFLREARAASGINHPNICTIHEIGTSDDGRLFIVMEYLDGSTLASRIRLGRPNSSETLSIFIQIAEGLNAAHQAGVIHRDIKPSNVSIDADGHLKLLDFGLAKSSTDDDGRVAESAPIDPTTEGHIVGTPNYMSPEQATGAVLDARTDIYSAAVTVLELITGENPFAGRDFSETTRKILSHTPGMLREKNPAIHPRLEQIVLKCLEKSPQDRYRTAAELLSDLRSLDTRLANFESTKAAPLESTIDDPDTDAAPASESDVFISFSSVDNQPLTTSHVGWVTQFFRDLQIRVQQITGEEIVVSPHAADSPLEDRQRSTVLKEIPMAKTMVAIVSPPYIKSPECRSQIEQYWDSVASETGGDARTKPRLLKVVKRPFEEKQTPEPLRVILPRLTEFNFFERNEETGRLIEYDEAFGETARQRYFERIYDLAQDIAELIESDKQALAETTNNGSSDSEKRPCVYLAETTSDLRNDRDQLRRELTERGFTVVPASPLPMAEPELSQEVGRLLQEVTVSIHPIGSNYGLIPEGASLSIVDLQLRLASGIEPDKRPRRFLWCPESRKPNEARQKEFLESVMHDEGILSGSEVVRESLNTLKEALLDRLSPKPKIDLSNAGVHGPGSASPIRVYIICVAEDEEKLEPIEDHLFSLGCEVRFPMFEGEPAEILEAHRYQLQTCDAALIVFGAGSLHWMDIKLLDLARATGYGRDAPIPLTGVLVGPPGDHRKKRFRTHLTEVYRQSGEAFTTDSIQPFVDRFDALRDLVEKRETEDSDA